MSVISDADETIDAIAERQMEQAAWHRVCHAMEILTRESINHQKYRPLISLMRIWGEELAGLRRAQGKKGIEWGHNVCREEATELAKQGIVVSYSAD